MESKSQLTLCSRLADLTLVSPWVDRVVAPLDLPPQLRFAIDLCLEEALSNVVRHGHRNDCTHSIVVRSLVQGEVHDARELVFVLEDDAPHFNPLAMPIAQSRVTPLSIEDLADGGRGISLLRRYAGSLHYEALPSGNRLTIGFPMS